MITEPLQIPSMILRRLGIAQHDPIPFSTAEALSGTGKTLPCSMAMEGM